MGFDHCEQTCDLKPDPQTFSSLGLAARENSEARTMRRAPSQRGSEDWKQNEGDCVIGIPSVRWQSAPLVGFKPTHRRPPTIEFPRLVEPAQITAGLCEVKHRARIIGMLFQFGLKETRVPCRLRRARPILIANPH